MTFFFSFFGCFVSLLSNTILSYFFAVYFVFCCFFLVYLLAVPRTANKK